MTDALRRFIESEIAGSWRAIQGRDPWLRRGPLHGQERAEARRIGLTYSLLRRLGSR